MDKEKFYFKGSLQVGRIALIVGIIGLVITLLGFLVNKEQFFHSYLAAIVFWVTFGLGALFMVMIHHLTGATWSVVLRRIMENISSTLPLMAVLFIPVLLGLDVLFHWSNPEVVAHDHLLQEKAAYLNDTFFVIRAVAYFAVWIFLSSRLYRKSLEQDKAELPAEVSGGRKTSAYGVILFAITASFAAFDWLMSLDAHWYSTIFGVYFFGGCAVALFSLLSLTAILLSQKGILAGVITKEHYHDLGRLLFTFVVFWSYIAFSQYFLIWYANIPEETIFFHHRWEGSWRVASVILALGHFLIPFLLLMIRSVKRSYLTLGIFSVWMFVMHWLDIHWLVMPNLHHHGVHLSWMDLTGTAGIGGLFFWWAFRNFARHPMVPVNDPKLMNSINLRN